MHIINIIGITTEDKNFKIINGPIPIFLSAPHAVKQCRNGITKGEDKLTGAIVEYLCMQTGVNGIIRTCNHNDDPNYDNNGDGLKYKEDIINQIKEKNIIIFMDIHGCTDNHGFDIEFGTNYGKNINYDTSCIEIFKKEFSEICKVAIDEEFKATGKSTVSNFIHEKSGIPCVQIEISRKLRKDKLIEMLKTMESSIRKIYRTKINEGDKNKEYDETCK